jgi:hypothetical protein
VCTTAHFIYPLSNTPPMAPVQKEISIYNTKRKAFDIPKPSNVQSTGYSVAYGNGKRSMAMMQAAQDASTLVVKRGRTPECKT